MFIGSPGWSVGVVRVLLLIWQTGPSFLNWLISSSCLTWCSELSAELSVCSWNQWMQQTPRSCEILHLHISNRTVRHWAAFRASGHVWKAWPMVSVGRDNSCFTGSGNLFLWFGAIWFRLEKKMWKSKHPASLCKLRTFSFLIFKKILKHVCKSCYYRCLPLIKHLKQTWNPQHKVISKDEI